jgi:hypothetical protein
VDDNAYDEGLNLTPPGEGFELWRHRNAGRLGTVGWSGLYWARRDESGGYEIRSVLREGEAYSYPGGVFPAATFERFYERVDPDSFETEA